MTDTKRLGPVDLFMVLATVFWGLNLTVVKIGLRHLPPHAFNSIRLAAAASLLFLFLVLKKEPLRLSRGDLLRVAILGILGNFCYQMMFIQGFTLTTASNASLILATSPIFIALLGSAFKMERLSWAGWLGIAISFVGLYLVITQSSGGFRMSGSGWRGDMMILGGNAFWAAYTVFSKPLLDRMSALKFSTMTLAWGAAAYLLFAVPHLGRLKWGAVPAESWLALAYSGVFAIVLGYVFWYTSVKAMGSSKTAVYNNLTPVLAILFASLLLGERIKTGQILGAVVILAGVYLTRTGDRFFTRDKIVSHCPE